MEASGMIEDEMTAYTLIGYSIRGHPKLLTLRVLADFEAHMHACVPRTLEMTANGGQDQLMAPFQRSD